MKKIILLFAFMGATVAANCQKVTRDAQGNYIAVKTVKDSTGAKPTGTTYTDGAGKVWPVYVSAKGKYFANVVSKNGNTYKKYLPQ